MSLRLLVDECLLNRRRVDMLVKSGHDVVTVGQAELIGCSDAAVLDYAITENRLVITSNCNDFINLHHARISANLHHPGILLLYLHNNLGKDMGHLQIVKAIANLEASKIPLADTTHSLNAYNY
ncbi:MAG: DUF5615 family PIN-like protein [Candidatus Obscuribacterales bacterium]|nr:DUF5615 family PIN-like protein [Candidatus Obscuribacterales bacterium]